MSELYHHGIKGQRWGIRRYQNEDGSLTPEGKARLEKAIHLHKEFNKLSDKASDSAGKQIDYLEKKKKYVQMLEFDDNRIGRYKWFDKNDKEIDLEKLYKSDPVFKKFTDDHNKDWDKFMKVWDEYDTEYSKIKNIKLGIGATIDNNWDNIINNYDKYYKNVKVKNL